jgi:hypothetical protein
MNFLMAHYSLRNLVLENQKRKICVGTNAEAFVQIPRVMSDVTELQKHHLTIGLQTIKEEATMSDIPKSINCPHCGQDINWCECTLTI